jgi:ABC-type nitrate/sulfonate/bicarbonate transport system substrate-binding protein
MRTLTVLAGVALVSIVSVASPLRVSLPPVLGAIPVVAATAWDLFRAEGIEVELVPLPGQRDRIFAFQAGHVDVMVADLTTALLLVSSVPQEALIVGTAYTPDPEANHIALVTPVEMSRIASWDEFAARLRGGPRLQIGLPRQSDLEFVVDEMLRRYGLSVPPDLYIGQDNLLVNATWTLFGMVAVGALPQPYVDYILNFGFPGKPTLLTLYWVPGRDVPPEVFVVRRPLAEAQPEAIAGFFRAVRQAITRLNTEDRDTLVATILPLAVDLFFAGGGPAAAEPDVRAQIEAGIAAIVIPTFAEPRAVDQDVYDRVMEWAMRKRYLRAPISYDTAVVSPPG